MIRIYKIDSKDLDRVKSVLEAPDEMTGELNVELEKEQGKGNKEKAKAWKVNEFKKQGYILREAKTLGIDEKVSYLQINGDESFFNRNEKVLLNAGAKKIEGAEYEEIKSKIEEQEMGASESIGFVFG